MACFTSPVIGLSMRYDRIDNFWFVLRHELEHVIRGHGRNAIVVDAELERERAGVGPGIADEERIANQAASDFCVPSEQLHQFVARKAPLFPNRDILGFARTLNIHPGLVAGQLQHQMGQYERFRNHLVKIRHAVAPSAMVDMVFVKGGGPPKIKHGTLAAAKAEAERLADKTQRPTWLLMSLGIAVPRPKAAAAPTGDTSIGSGDLGGRT